MGCSPASRFAASRPVGQFSAESVTPQQYRYFAVEEQINCVRRCADEIDELIIEQRELIDGIAVNASAPRRTKRLERIAWGGASFRRILKEMTAACGIVQIESACVAASNRAAVGKSAPDIAAIEIDGL